MIVINFSLIIDSHSCCREYARVTCTRHRDASVLCVSNLLPVLFKLFLKNTQGVTQIKKLKLYSRTYYQHISSGHFIRTCHQDTLSEHVIRTLYQHMLSERYLFN